MSVERFDLVITGSGFAGAIMAMIARRLGHSVLLLEKGSHPRFVIGESSTPLTNLLLETIALEYDLPRLLPFTKWGTWQRSYAEIGCGLKRGFSFFHHTAGQPFSRTPTHENELMVAASPHDSIADTHWYRPDFDHFLVREAQSLGADYRDQLQVEELIVEENYVEIVGRSRGGILHVQTRQLIDASGPGGFLRHHLKLGAATQPHLLSTEGLYTHFRSVPPLDTLPEFHPHPPPPYPQDASAVHHLFEGGWIWVLRFNNGITSAGVSATSQLAAELKFAEGEPAWHRLLDRFSSLRQAFAGAEPTLPFRHHQPLAFRLNQICGKNWLLLPSAAGFIDPLLSTGFPLTLLGIVRVAEMLKRHQNHYVPALEKYALATFHDFDAVELLVGALFRNLHHPGNFRWLSFLYFAPMLYCECSTRLGRRSPAAGFLMRDDERFWPEAQALLEEIIKSGVKGGTLQDRITQLIAPYDLGGLLESSRNNWYPADSSDLLRNAHKVGVTRGEMQEMLKRCGA